MPKVVEKHRTGVCCSSYHCHRLSRMLRPVATDQCRRYYQIPSLPAATTIYQLEIYFQAAILMYLIKATGLFPRFLKMLQLQGRLHQRQHSQMTISLTNQIGCLQFMCKFLPIGRHCLTYHLLQDHRTYTRMAQQQMKEPSLVHCRTTLRPCKAHYRPVRSQAP